MSYKPNIFEQISFWQPSIWQTDLSCDLNCAQNLSHHHKINIHIFHQTRSNISKWQSCLFHTLLCEMMKWPLQFVSSGTSFHTLLVSNQLNRANNWPNDLFKREMRPSGTVITLALFVSPGKPSSEKFVTDFLWIYWKYFLNQLKVFPQPKRRRPGSQQSANRPL